MGLFGQKRNRLHGSDVDVAKPLSRVGNGREELIHAKLR